MDYHGWGSSPEALRRSRTQRISAGSFLLQALPQSSLIQCSRVSNYASSLVRIEIIISNMVNHCLDSCVLVLSSYDLCSRYARRLFYASRQSLSRTSHSSEPPQDVSNTASNVSDDIKVTQKSTRTLRVS